MSSDLDIDFYMLRAARHASPEQVYPICAPTNPNGMNVFLGAGEVGTGKKNEPDSLTTSRTLPADLLNPKPRRWN
jgi:hypothetical protein